MPEATVETPVVNTTVTPTPETTSLGWRAGLPDDLKQNTDLANYKTVGDFTKDALSWKGKVSELEGKLGDSIPKLPDDATDEDRNTYLDALGRPTTAADYKLDGEDKSDPKSLETWKGRFHRYGLTQDQANGIVKEYGADINKLVDDFKAKTQQEITASEQLLRGKWGDKFDANTELSKRLWQTYGKKEEFDKSFSGMNEVNKFTVMEMIFDFASKTGEDTSPQGGHSTGGGTIKPEDAWMKMYQNPVGGRK